MWTCIDVNCCMLPLLWSVTGDVGHMSRIFVSIEVGQWNS